MKIGDKALGRTSKVSHQPAPTKASAEKAAEKTNGWSPTGKRPALNRNATQTTATDSTASAASVTPTKPLWVPPSEGQWTVDAHGVRSDPVNIYVHGDLSKLKQALTKSGWVEAKQNNKENNLAYLEAVPQHELNTLADKLGNVCESLWYKLTGKKINLDVKDSAKLQATIDSMPVSKQTLDGAGNLTGFEMNNDPLGGRDHLRIFDTGKVDGQGQPVWAIAASRDTGIKFDKNRPEQGFLNHAVESNTDLERNTVVEDLQGTHLIANTTHFGVDYGGKAAEATGAKSGDNQVFNLVLD